MKVKTKVKAGAITHNHNETLVRDAVQARSLKVKTGVKGGIIPNGGTSSGARAHARGLTVKTGIKAGSPTTNNGG
jgi:hypothetical protein